MRIVPSLAFIGLAIGIAAGCGDGNHLDCKPGTFKSGDDCVAGDPNDKTAPVTAASPTGSRARSQPGFVTLSSDEPGVTIHYTTDGSDPVVARPGEPSPVVITPIVSGTTIKFFGVDASGNVEATHTETYVVDVTPPGPVTNFALSSVGQTATLTWTNPTDSDYAGTLVARIDDVLDARPTPGQLYTAPASLSPFVSVLATAAATTTNDAGRPTGPARYVAWTFDDLGNYSAPAFVSGDLGTLGLTGTLTYDTGTDTLTITSAPASVDLTGTTAEFATATATIHLSVKNTTGTYFQNPKISISSATNGVFSNSSGNADGKPFKYLGTGFFAPGETRMIDLTFTAAPTTTITVDLALAQHASFVASSAHACCGPNPYRFLDLGANINSATMGLQTGGRNTNSRRGGMMSTATMVGQHFIDIANNHGSIERWDLVTQTLSSSVLLRQSDDRIVVDTVIDIDGYEYAVTRTNGRPNTGGFDRLIRLDESLQVLDTLDLSSLGDVGNGFMYPQVSPDHKLLALPGQSRIVLVDLATMTLHDADPSTPIVDSIHFVNGQRFRSLEWLQGSDGFLAIRRDGQVSIVKLSATGYTTTETSYSGKIFDTARTEDGRIWIGTENGLFVYTPLTGAITATSYTNGVQALFVTGGNLWALQTDRTTVEELDTDANAVATLSITSCVGHGGIATKP